MRKHDRQLNASVEASGPHDFAVRFRAVRQRRIHVHRIPPRVRDDREPPLLVGRDGKRCTGVSTKRRNEKFLRMGVDRKCGEKPDGQISLQRVGK